MKIKTTAFIKSFLINLIDMNDDKMKSILMEGNKIHHSDFDTNRICIYMHRLR